MALGSNIKFRNNFDRGEVYFQSSLSGPYVPAIDAGGLASADAATISTPAATITASTRKIISVEPWQGTSLVFSAFYDAAATLPVGGTYVVFGRYNDGANTPGPWRRLTNKAGAISRAITFDATNDPSDGTLKYTTPSPTDDIFDRLNNNEILVGIETAHSVSTGSAALAGLSVCIV